MLPIVKANTESTQANRDLILSVLEGVVEQNQRASVLWRQIAVAVTALADEMETQEAETERRLELMAESLNSKADKALRKKAGNALRAASDRITNMLNKLRGQ